MGEKGRGERVLSRDIAKLQIVIRKAELELDRIISLLVSKDGQLKDTDVISLLIFRKIIEKIDAIFILHDNGHQNTADSIARDAFENYVYLAFMLDERYEYRASAYQFQSLQTQLELIDWFDPNNKKAKKLKSLIGNKVGQMPKQLKERRAYINKRLLEEPFKNLQVDWKRKEKDKNKGGRYPTWYNISKGKDSIAALCRYLKMDDEYETMYALFSHEVHSTNALNQLTTVNNQGAFKPIREDVKESLSLQVAISIGVRANLKILGHFDIQSVNDYSIWYAKDLPKEVVAELKME
ncbi:hypothetical protein CSV79_01655 [Sporosarcina sp. P13]|uniref:DUF5677 domain-containing protein n=1 Tax=Sporosarcina sp. P13 TaxID=2048263 RepID=UPI000C169269|nr:DUF5677 domain-containing protein [Sporosarcina sp. P13]PIC65353.1 hypothetical protein CSV79_01655 [Sporosarcina sp. P13]